MDARLLLRTIHLRLLQGLLRLIGERERRVVALRSMLQTGIRVLTFEREGLVWTVRLDDHIGIDTFINGGYQRKEIQALLAWMRRAGTLARPRDVVIDVGANIGTTCIPMVRETGCRALAVEPVAENFLHLKENVESNSLSERIVLAKRAVSRTPGSLRMCLTDAPGGHFVARNGKAGFPNDTIVRYEEVEADTLTGIIASAGLGTDEIAIVWADVQGCELDVIESGQALWEFGVPLWAEVEPRSLIRQGSLSAFASGAAAHFDRFIDSRDLMRLGDKANPRPIGELGKLIEGIKPEQVNTDILLLPRGF
jgi:FkbM family methyltransferase